MDIDEQGNQFEGDDHVPIEEMEKLNEFTSSGTMDNDDDGKPKAIKESGQDTRLVIRICDFCGKTFKGGKALGGHRRSHLQTKKVGFSKNIKKSVLGHSASDSRGSSSANLRMGYDPMDGKRCCICNKDFPSMQSLFGHMRSHPDRGWRGMQPPLPSDRNSSSSSTSNSVYDHNSSTGTCMGREIDLLKSVSNWSKSDRRGRGSIGCAWAAETIMSFSLGKDSNNPNQTLSSSYCRSTNGPVIDSKKSGRHSISCTDRSIDDPSAVEKQRTKKLKIHRSGSLRMGNKSDEAGRDEHEEKRILEHSESKNAKDGMSGEPSKLDSYQISQKKMKMKKIMMCWAKKLRHSETEELDLIDKTQKVPYRYECSDCGKSFPTFQALGGHRSSHNKVKIQKTNASFEAASAGDQEKISANHSFQMDETKESSKALAMVRSTLNGNIRYNRTGVVVETPSSEGASPAEASTQSAPKIASPKEASQSGPRRLDFDLNIEPHVMEVENIWSAFNQN